MADELKKLHKSKSDKVIAGVCGGLADATEIPSWVWRAGFVFWGLCGGTGVIAYLIFAIFMPADPPVNTGGDNT